MFEEETIDAEDGIAGGKKGDGDDTDFEVGFGGKELRSTEVIEVLRGGTNVKVVEGEDA